MGRSRPQNVKRKKGDHSFENMLRALRLNRSGMSIRNASKACNIAYTTLRRYIVLNMNVSSDELATKRLTPNYENQKIFTDEQEEELYNYYAGYTTGLTAKECRKMAYNMAVINKIPVPESWNLNESAGRDWLRSFRDRHPEFCLKSQLPKFVVNQKPEKDSTMVQKLGKVSAIFQKPEKDSPMIQKPEIISPMFQKSGKDSAIFQKPEKDSPMFRKPDKDSEMFQKPEKDPATFQKPEKDPATFHKPEKDPAVFQKSEKDSAMFQKPEKDSAMFQKPEKDSAKFKDKLDSQIEVSTSGEKETMTFLEFSDEGISENEEGISENEKGISENEEGISENEEGVSENEERVSENEERVSENEERVSENEEGIGVKEDGNSEVEVALINFKGLARSDPIRRSSSGEKKAPPPIGSKRRLTHLSIQTNALATFSVESGSDESRSSHNDEERQEIKKEAPISGEIDEDTELVTPEYATSLHFTGSKDGQGRKETGDPLLLSADSQTRRPTRTRKNAKKNPKIDADTEGLMKQSDVLRMKCLKHKMTIQENEFINAQKRAREIHETELMVMKERLREAKAKAELAELLLQQQQEKAKFSNPTPSTVKVRLFANE